MKAAKDLAKGSFFLFLGNTSSTFILAMASIVIARLLGPENYGIYNVALIIPTFLIILTDFGISPALTKFSSQFNSEREEGMAASLIKVGIVFKITVSLIFSLILFFLSRNIALYLFKRPGISFLIEIASLYVFGDAIFLTITSIFNGLNKMENSGSLLFIRSIIKAIASPLLIVLGLGVAGTIWGLALSSLFASAIGLSLLFLFTFPMLYKQSSDKEVDFLSGLKLMVLYGIPLYSSNIIGRLLNQYQIILLAFFASNFVIGNYNIAMNVSVVITLLSFPIATALFPAFSRLKITDDYATVEKSFKLSIRYTSLLLVPATLLVSVLSKDIVHALYGPKYELAPTYLSFYILVFLCAGFGMFVIGNFFNAQGDTKSTFKMSLVEIAILATLSSVLTFFLDILGLIASFLISKFVSIAYGLYLAKRKYMVSFDRNSALKIYLSSFLSTLPVYLFRTIDPTPLLNVAIGGSLYVITFLILAPLFGAISKSDVENLNDTLKEVKPIYPLVRLILNFEKKIIARL